MRQWILFESYLACGEVISLREKNCAKMAIFSHSMKILEYHNIYLFWSDEDDDDSSSDSDSDDSDDSINESEPAKIQIRGEKNLINSLECSKFNPHTTEKNNSHFRLHWGPLDPAISFTLNVL